MNKKGFTLVELLVVCAIFSLIILVLMNIFISTLKSQKYTLTSQQLVSQSSYVIEYMSRFIRMAKADNGTCADNPGRSNYSTDSDGAYLKFRNYKTDVQQMCDQFYLIPDPNNANINQLYESRGSSEGASGDQVAITSEQFNVKALKFSVSGDQAGQQPKVTIFLQMEGVGSAPQPSITLQTTVSQRDLNISQ